MANVKKYLKDLHFLQTWDEMELVEEAYLKEMDAGLAGSKSSLPMIPAYLTADSLPEDEQTVIVMDAGGTNLRVSLLKIKPGETPDVLYSHKRLMPGKNNPISKEEFFDALAAEVAPIADRSDRIGFCFSFPCRILPDLDGEVLYLDKEVMVNNIEGSKVGVELKKGLERAGCAHDQKVVILNDTVAALLGALVEHPAQYWSGFIGMILGTGMNCCYSEDSAKVLKDIPLSKSTGHSIINMEAGSFNALPITEADRMVAEATANAEGNLAEKMMSGAYQGPLMAALLKLAARDGLISAATAKKMEEDTKEVTATNISALMAAPTAPSHLHDLAANEEDLRTICALAEALLERAAKLAVMNLTAIMRHTGTGTDPLKPVAIAIEGTTYEKNDMLRMKIRTGLIEYTMKKRGFYSRVFATRDANMVGSAVAAMSVG